VGEISQLCSGPGKLTQALGVGLDLNGAELTAEPFEIVPPAEAWDRLEVVTSTRIGITKAAELPWRYCASGNRFVSRPWPRVRSRAA
jgi:DNA-3-methyladenine glycosylase